MTTRCVPSALIEFSLSNNVASDLDKETSPNDFFNNLRGRHLFGQADANCILEIFIIVLFGNVNSSTCSLTNIIHLENWL